MAKKQLIRLTEGDLHKIIKESVKKVLTEAQYDAYTGKDKLEKFWNKPYVLDNRGSEDWYKRIKNSLTSNEIMHDEEFLEDNLSNDWQEMCNKLSQYDDPGEVLDKLIKKNPIFKKWYENNKKKREIESSWRGFDDRTHDTKEFYDDEKDELNDALPFASDEDNYHRYDAW